MRSLAVASLSIRDFRNLARVDLELGARFNVLFGDNGQGKTNLLEAVYVLATSRSFRTARLDEMIGTGAETTSLRGQIHEAGEEREQSVGMRRGVRATRIDGKRPPSLAAYALRTPTVVFHPGAIALSAGGGSERRRLLDRAALYASPASLAEGLSYAKAMRARQRVLEKRGEGAGDLDGWEELMVRHGRALADARAGAAGRLVPAAVRAFARIGAPGLTLQARYEPGAPADDDAFRGELARRRVQDRARGAASVGPHRDDLSLRLGTRPVRGMASQGQHRAVVLALELAEIEVITEARGVRPILLLDDVSSELDSDRTAALLGALREERGQVLVTTTRPELIDAAGLSGDEGRMSFRVVGGTITPIG
jgi:DNA replication and repair protein RecF